MLQGEQNSQNLRNKIDALKFSEKSSQMGYSNLFYEHLIDLYKYKMVSDNNNIDNMVLTEKNYHGIEQFVFENSKLIEVENFPLEINWDYIDEGKDYFEEKLKKSLKREGNSEYLKPLIKSSVNLFENSLIYYSMYPQTNANPWAPTDTILYQNGYLLLISDQKDLISNYNPKIVDRVSEESTPLFVLGSNASEKKFSGFPIDRRTSTQSIVFEFLKREASGLNRAIDAIKIQLFLNDQGRKMDIQWIKGKVLLPLKRAGLIGSSTKGYFYINSHADLEYAYRHHLEKLNGIQRTLEMYKIRAIKMGFELK